MQIGDIHLTSEIFWQSALIAASIDAVLIVLILRCISPEFFFRLSRPLIVSAGVFWGVLGICIVQSFWDGYYRFIYPGWMRGWGIILFAPSIGMVLAVLFYWIARHFRNHPIPAFFIAVGAEALFEHLLGICSLKIMEIPMFLGVNPLAVLAFSIPEYILYWGAILLAAFVIQRTASRVFQRPETKPAQIP